MKLLFITSSAPFGKGESFVITEVNAIAKLGHSVILVPTLIRKGNPNNFELHENINLLAKPLITFIMFFNFLVFFISRPICCFKLFYMVSDRQIVNSFKNYLVIPKSIWLAKYLKKNPVDHIHVHWLTASSTLAMLVGTLVNVKWSATAHRGDIVANNILEIKFKSASFIRFISKSGKDLATSRANILEDKAKILHLGVDLENLVSINSMVKMDSSGLFSIVCPANLIAIKGHDFLINSISKMKFLNEVRVFFVGEGALRPVLENKVKKLGLEKSIVFCGHIPHSELLGWYKSGEVNAVVLPSLDLGKGVHEGIPVSLMEAMAFNIPVISTRTGGIPELLEEDSQKYGGLVEPYNTKELSKLLDDLLQYPEKSQKLVKLGYERVNTDFNQISSISELLKLIKHAI